MPSLLPGHYAAVKVHKELYVTNRGTALPGLAIPSRATTHLKNLLIFSCNSLVGTKNRFGRYYDECASRGMRYNRALKAVARKRLGVIYAVMRDRVPNEEPPSGADVEKSPVTA